MNYYKNKTKLKTKNPVPRAMDEINKTYNYLCSQAGAIKIGIRLKEKELENVLTALENVNAEANARQKLDDESKAKDVTPATTEVANG